MNINSNAVINRIEIIYYSILTACLNGVERIRDLNNRHREGSQKPIRYEEQATYINTTDYSQKIKISRWPDFYQAIVPFMIWLILGFATGFFIGLINPK
jgi:hypothetical protein